MCQRPGWSIPLHSGGDSERDNPFCIFQLEPEKRGNARRLESGEGRPTDSIQSPSSRRCMDNPRVGHMSFRPCYADMLQACTHPDSLDFVPDARGERVAPCADLRPDRDKTAVFGRGKVIDGQSDGRDAVRGGRTLHRGGEVVNLDGFPYIYRIGLLMHVLS